MSYSFSELEFKWSFHVIGSLNQVHVISGVARPRPTRACALPSTFQALPSAAKNDSRDFIKNWKYSSYSS